MTEPQILKLLDEAGLTSERAKHSKKIYLMRQCIICKYILLLTRAEAIAYIFKISDIIICDAKKWHYLAEHSENDAVKNKYMSVSNVLMDLFNNEINEMRVK